MASKSPITCHVLDSSIGKPAEGVGIRLVRRVEEPDPSHPAHGGTWLEIGTSGSVTNADGRCLGLLPPDATGSPRTIEPGSYQLVFDVKGYFERTGRKSFYPFVQITFTIEDPSEHYHVPLLISPFSYTTYRGS